MILKWRLYRSLPYRKRFFLLLSWMGMLVLAMFWITLLGGCTGFGSFNPSPTGPTVKEPDKDLSPKLMHIKAGETVTWMNRGQTTVLRVPENYATVQAAVNAARVGDMISIAPGIYHEAVTVRTSGLTIRGRDRNSVIMDGNFNLG